MATHASAAKRARQNLKRRERNRAHRTALRTALKKYRALLAAKDPKGAAAAYSEIQKTIDKAKTKGIIHRNAANRYKARLAARLKKLGAAA